jgi:hypothetical protein
LSVGLKERTDGRFSCCEIQIAYKDVFHIVVMSFNRAARLGRFGPRPGCCRTLKRLFQYSRTLPADTGTDLPVPRCAFCTAWTGGSVPGFAGRRGLFPYFTATSQIFSRLDLPSGPSTSRVTV